MITMTCQRCEASIKTENVVEAIKWDVSHDEVCPNLPHDEAAQS